jgi:hypothetical protein
MSYHQSLNLIVEVLEYLIVHKIQSVHPRGGSKAVICKGFLALKDVPK